MLYIYIYTPPPSQQDSKEKPEAVIEYGQMLEVWCREIERYLEAGCYWKP